MKNNKKRSSKNVDIKEDKSKEEKTKKNKSKEKDKIPNNEEESDDDFPKEKINKINELKNFDAVTHFKQNIIHFYKNCSESIKDLSYYGQMIQIHYRHYAYKTKNKKNNIKSSVINYFNINDNEIGPNRDIENTVFLMDLCDNKNIQILEISNNINNKIKDMIKLIENVTKSFT